VVNSVWFCGVAGRDYFYFLMIDNPYSLVVVLEVMGFDFQKYLDIFLEGGLFETGRLLGDGLQRPDLIFLFEH
jgi:hypothetical protein